MIAAALFLIAAQSAAAIDAPPVLVELFTSQSCSSCPPAEANFVKLAARKDVVALEWHVDYWNDISVGADGRWRDPFSSAENTERQRRYNLALRKRATVYTPQAVINGARETVGSRGPEIDRLIAASRNTAAAASIAIDKAGDQLKVLATGPEGAGLRLVRFQRSAMTRVGGGENARAALAEANIVLATQLLAQLGAGAKTAQINAPKTGEGCAILVESPDGGPVLAARYCQ